MDLTLTYAISVHVVDLGANLDAHMETLPLVNTLRLCHRYGRGNKAFITKLPAELLARVESSVMQSTRDRARKEWMCEFNATRKHAQWSITSLGTIK